MRRRINRKKPGRRKLPALPLVLLAAVLLAGLIGGVTARYIGQHTSQPNQVGAEDFFFTLDLLGENNSNQAEVSVSLYGGGTQNLSFQVQNYFDALRVTQEPITYTVSVTGSENRVKAYAFADGESEAVDATRTFTLGGALKEGETQSALAQGFTLQVEDGYETGDGVTVTVTSSAPYQKTMVIHATLYQETPEVLYRVEDTPGGLCATLTVLTRVELDGEAVEVTLPDGLVIDTTNRYVLDGLTLDTNDPAGQGGTLTTVTNSKAVAAGESMTLRLMKTDPQADYSTSGDVELTEKNGRYSIVIEEANKQ